MQFEDIEEHIPTLIEVSPSNVKTANDGLTPVKSNLFISLTLELDNRNFIW
jgi:hypothetical protein